MCIIDNIMVQYALSVYLMSMRFDSYNSQPSRIAFETVGSVKVNYMLQRKVALNIPTNIKMYHNLVNGTYKRRITDIIYQ